MPDEKHEESEVVEALKAATKVDWKGIALIITALTGALGFAWNKVELYVQQYQQQKTQQQVTNTDAAAGGAYEAIATRLDELFLKVEVLERQLNVKVDYVPLEAVPDPEPPRSLGAAAGFAEPMTREEPEPEPDEMEDLGAIGVTAPPVKPEPVSKRFKRARLPEFEAVQQAARDDLEQFIKEVKAK